MKTLDDNRFYISTDQGLQRAAKSWLSNQVLGFDTEFIRTDTFHPQPALIQVSDGQQCWLVDVLTIQDLSPLGDVIVAPNIIKIFHAASEDLEVFDRLLGKLPSPLFDTQIAASFCGHGASIGYSKLVQTLLDIELSKDQCRSDWLARPLTPDQLHYATLDVLYLPTLYKQLQQQLSRESRLHWAEEDNQRQLVRYEEQRDASYNLDRINQVWKLDQTERQRLWHLLIGRDALARHHNKPRNHIARDHALVDIARRPPRHVAELSALDGLRPASIRQFGQHLITLANDVPADLQTPPVIEPMTKLETTRYRELRTLADSIADSVNLPPELLARRQELEQFVRQFQPGKPLSWPARFGGWRGELLAEPFTIHTRQWLHA